MVKNQDDETDLVGNPQLNLHWWLFLGGGVDPNHMFISDISRSSWLKVEKIILSPSFTLFETMMSFTVLFKNLDVSDLSNNSKKPALLLVASNPSRVVLRGPFYCVTFAPFTPSGLKKLPGMHRVQRPIPLPFALLQWFYRIRTLLWQYRSPCKKQLEA